MYNLLIIDDEMIIREGLYELLSLEEDLELNIYRAASGLEAISILEENKIEIVLTDIKMPKMNGIELFHTIKERWPYCKVIFLTVYSEFDYVYQVNGKARYLLKGEEDNKIINEIKEVIEEIENDFINNQIKQEVVKLRNISYGFRSFIKNFIKETLTKEEFIKGCQDFNLPIKIHEECYVVTCRIDKFKVDKSRISTENLYEKIQFLCHKYLLSQIDGFCFIYKQTYLGIIVQPNTRILKKTIGNFLKSTCEFIQKASKTNNIASLSFAIGLKEVEVDDIPSVFNQLKLQLLQYNLEENIIVYANKKIVDSSLMYKNEKSYVSVSSNDMELLELHFENFNQYAFFEQLFKLCDVLRTYESIHDTKAIEIYLSIATMLMSFINKLNLNQEICFKIGMNQLYKIDQYKTWAEASEYLQQISHVIFELQIAKINKVKNNVIDDIKNFIEHHIHEDISLTRLADEFHFSPEYIARMFKKKEGITVLQYINQYRLYLAEKLLYEKDIKINEIANQLGFSSAGYFTRFFKKHKGMTPQAFKDRKNK